MKEVIERCNWLVNKCNDKAITPDVKADFRYLLEEIERLNKVLKYLENYFSNREDYELAQIVRDIKEANIEWLDKAIGSDKE